MSFSMDVKEELSHHTSKSRHCQIAELSALIMFGNRKRGSGEDLIGHFPYQEELLDSVKFDKDGVVEALIVQQTCCKRAFLRGAFIEAGSISDPSKGYHLEIVCDNEASALFLQSVMSFFEVESKFVQRAGKQVVYLKEGAQIVEMLRIMEAPKAVMELENVRIVKEMRGSINRQVNCEAANISKTVNAAVRQIEDIKYLAEEVGLDNLPVSLSEIAYLRLKHADTPLGALGELCDPPLGKSGVNHRLRRLSQLATEHRKGNY